MEEPFALRFIFFFLFHAILKAFLLYLFDDIFCCTASWTIADWLIFLHVKGGDNEIQGEDVQKKIPIVLIFIYTTFYAVAATAPFYYFL